MSTLDDQPSHNNGTLQEQDAPSESLPATGPSSSKKDLRYIDIAINLTDAMYRGIYHDKRVHPPDVASVLSRAVAAGCHKLMITGSDLAESERAVALAREHPGLCYATVGVHPCSALQFTTHPSGAASLLSSLHALAASASASGHCCAFGEIGLDYDRLSHCDAATQRTYFSAQLSLAATLDLPLFLHSRGAAADFAALLAPPLRAGRLPRGGLVHSFTGSLAEMQALLALGLHIGVNGCSLKTAENLDVMRALPLDRLQLETDGPWCEIRPSHAGAALLEGFVARDEEGEGGGARAKPVKKERWEQGRMVKGRNEPCEIAKVAWVVARVKDVPVEEVVAAAWRNSVAMFGLGERGT